MKTFQFENPRQASICIRLKQIGPGLAALYRDTCILSKTEEPIESRSHLIAHLFREIESGICAVLEMPEDREKRKKMKLSQGHHKKIENILKILDIPMDHQISMLWFEILDKDMHSLAHRNALDVPRPLDDELLTTIDKIETVYDNVLARFESKYLKWFEILDNLLLITQPSERDLEILRNNVPYNPVTLGYFFDRLKKPEWLLPLKKEGFFRYLPEPENDPENNSVKYPFWPQSNYLVEMAKCVPKDVCELILELPDTTNIRICDDFVVAILEMPPIIAMRCVPKVKTWVNLLHQHILPQRLGHLLSHLANGHQEGAALDLAKSMLELRLDAKTSDIISHFDAWNYSEILKKHIPDLIEASGKNTLIMLCDVLQGATQRSLESNKEDHGFHPWRRRIEEEDGYGLREVINPLISAIRDAAILLIDKKEENVLDIIETYPYKIFMRIGLYLRRKYPEIDKEKTEKLIIDATIFDDTNLRNEYYLLIKEQFSSFQPATQASYIQLIEDGHSIRKQLETRERITGIPWNIEEKERMIRYWQYSHLYSISAYLNESLQEKFITLQSEFGEPSFVNPVSEVHVGPTSPKPFVEIESLTNDQLVLYLIEWHPTKEFMAPSPEGLGRELQKLIISNPTRFADEAEKFKGLDPTYLRAIFLGFREVVTQNYSISWTPVLNLCDWVMSQPRDIPGRRRDLEDFDSDWGWTRKAIAYMLIAGFQQGKGEIPFTLRKNVWDVLSQITSDPNPTLDDESSYEPSNFYPSELSINTTRGEAMHAVIHYALWVQEHTVGEVNNEVQNPNGFDNMPEVRETLEYHLDIKNDPSLAIRSVYGRWFPYLFNMDSEWASRNVKTIFPQNDALKIYFNAAWDAYVIYNNPYDGVFELLDKEYHYAIELMASNPCEESRRLNPDKRLAEHIMMGYWQDKIKLTEQGELMVNFYQKAPNALFGHAIEFIGFSLQKTKGEISQEIIDKFKTLWLHRLNIVKEQHPDDITEIIPYWKWFNSEKFDDGWAINQMIEVLKLRGKIKPEILITKRLATLSTQMPYKTITCLDLMLGNEKEWWVIHSCKDDARIILENGLIKGDEKTIEMAKALINKLAFNGFTEFRTLLLSQ